MMQVAKTTDTITLEFTREISEEQMAILRTLAMLANKSLEDFLWQMIQYGIQAELSGPLSLCKGCEKLESIIIMTR